MAGDRVGELLSPHGGRRAGWSQDGLHLCAEDLLLIEVIDPGTGERLDWTDGVEGELVVTHLRRECAPLVRFRVRDHVVVNAAPYLRAYQPPVALPRAYRRPAACGRFEVWPSAIKDVIASMAPRTTGAMQILLDEVGPVVRPPLREQVEYGHDEEDLEGLRGAVERSLRQTLMLRALVELVPPRSLPRWEMKAQLVRRGGSRD